MGPIRLLLRQCLKRVGMGEVELPHMLEVFWVEALFTYLPDEVAELRCVFHRRAGHVAGQGVVGDYL